MAVQASAERRTVGRVAARWLPPTIGSIALFIGGAWAVDLSQGDGVRSAVNPVSVGLYVAMTVLYGLVTLAIRRMRQPTLPAAERRSRAAAEAFLVAFAGAPLVLMVMVLRALYVGDLGQ